MPADADERTEAPTPRRRREARDKGQVARSQDLTSAVLMLAGFCSLALLGPPLWHVMLRVTAAGLANEWPVDPDEMLRFCGAAVTEVGKAVAPLIAVLFLSILAVLYMQVGWLLTWQPLVPSLSKINPLNGIKRLVSIRAVMQAVVNVGKLLAVAAVAALTLSGGAAAIIYSFHLSFFQVLPVGASLMFELGVKLAAALLVLALFDFAWQRHRHERDLRMTKEEVKDELRSMEGNPDVKRRRRQLQMQVALQTLRRDVPNADVVVTNPTHFAVAIRYDAETMVAPKVVAKGADYLALRIRQIAAESRIPIVERKPLARALYESVDVGQYVPERFYRAIAEILAYIYELTGRAPTLRPTGTAGAR